MEGFPIVPYNAEEHSAAMKAMLAAEGHWRENFDEGVQENPEGVFVALSDGTPVGFLCQGKPARGVGTTIYVDRARRRKGIGTALMRKADAMLRDMDRLERSMCSCLHGDFDALQFLYKNGYYVSHSSYCMERTGPLLPAPPIEVRPYEDKDYFAWQSLQDTAFYHMRVRVGMMPHVTYRPDEAERAEYLATRADRYVMVDGGEIVAVGRIEGAELSIVAVRHDMQSRGYGKAFVSWLVNQIMARGADTVTLWVVAGNWAKRLYDALGFVEKAQYDFLVRYYRPDSRPSAPLEA